MSTEVIVFAIDCDDCLYNAAFKYSDEDDALETSNFKLINHIVDILNTGLYDKAFITGFSVRQDADHQVIKHRVNRPLSYYKLLKQFCDIIQKRVDIPCEIDGYVMADTDGGHAPGYTFDRVLQGHSLARSLWWVDMSKRTIVFGQAQKKLNEPDLTKANVTMHVVDDAHDMLQSLIQYYQEYAEIMPPRFKLKVLQYDGTILQYLKTDAKEEIVQGCGIEDPNWEKNLKLLVKYINQSPYSGPCPDILVGMRAFFYERHLTPLALCESLSLSINAAALRAFPYTRAFQEAFLESIYLLQAAIETELQSQLNQKIDTAEFASTHPVRVARETIRMLHDASRIPLFKYDYVSENDRSRATTLATYAQRCYPSFRSYWNYFFPRSQIDQCVRGVMKEVRKLADEEETVKNTMISQNRISKK